MLTLAFVTGTVPDKWFRRYEQRSAHSRPLRAQGEDDPVQLLLNGEVDAALVRFPEPRIDREDYHVVELYTESAGVAVPKESVYAELGEALRLEDVAGEPCHYAPERGQTVAIPDLRMGLQVVAANVGVVVGPRPILAQLGGKQVRDLELLDAPWGETRIGIVWAKERDDDDIQDLVGIMKGRRAQSTRQGGGDRGKGDQDRGKKLSAREKTLAKQERRATRGENSGTQRRGGKKTGARGAGRGNPGVGRRGRRRRRG